MSLIFAFSVDIIKYFANILERQVNTRMRLLFFGIYFRPTNVRTILHTSHRGIKVKEIVRKTGLCSLVVVRGGLGQSNFLQLGTLSD